MQSFHKVPTTPNCITSGMSQTKDHFSATVPQQQLKGSVISPKQSTNVLVRHLLRHVSKPGEDHQMHLATSANNIDNNEPYLNI